MTTGTRLIERVGGQPSLISKLVVVVVVVVGASWNKSFRVHKFALMLRLVAVSFSL